MLLAPIVRERKGEHLHTFEQLKRDGFIRARINGLLVDLDDAPKLDKKKKHTIEVVVDRFKVRNDLKLRLAESFETALKLSEGIASISYMDGEESDRLFSSKHACPVCDYSLTELEPRLFSFNNPAGACPTCDGLGVKQSFDEDKVVQFPEASLSEGAIRGWDKRNIYYFHMLASLAEHYGFDVDTPWKKLKQKQQDAVLYGSGSEVVAFNYVNDRDDVHKRSHTFEGVLPNMERRYRDTESQMVRDELAKFLSTHHCPECKGARLRVEARNVFVDERTLPQITEMPVADALEYFLQLEFSGRKAGIADKILKELRDRFRFLFDVGLNYLTLNRSAETLSGGEAQRIRLASQIGAGLVGVMYILDEPSIGLHQRDNDRLLRTLTHLRDLGNTVIVVEHDEDAIRLADHVIDIGPGAGVHGGEVVAQGTPEQIMATPGSLTGEYLSGARAIEVPAQRTAPNPEKMLRLEGASGNNFKNVTLEIPFGLFTCITGVSGSGKSTLINSTLYPIAAERLNGASTLTPSPYKAIHGLELFDKVIDIDQSPIGRTPRSNPATYTGIFTPVRELFAGTRSEERRVGKECRSRRSA